MKNSKTYKDHRGNDIPSNYIHKLDKDKHAAAERFVKQAMKLSEQMSKFKSEVIDKCDELYNKALEENKVSVRQNAKGGYTVSTIDKRTKVVFTISETMRFDDNIDIAQELIQQYLESITSDGVNPDLKLLINEAFKTRKGQLDTKRVMGLLKLEIKNEKWVRAMELIRKSISVDSKKRYISFWTTDVEGKESAVKLDFANL